MGELKNNREIQFEKKPRGGPRPGAGRPKGKVSEAKRTIAEAARAHAEAALQVLVDVAKDSEAPAAARVSAANAIIDRGYGKPVAQVAFAANPLQELLQQINERGSAMPIHRHADDEEVEP